MRFCPFCSAENADDLAACQSCGRRLPPLPPRRARNAPPTGVLLPPRTATTTQPPPVTAPRRSPPTTNPPPSGDAGEPRPRPGAAQPGVMVTSAGLVPVAASPSGGLRAPAPPSTPPATLATAATAVAPAIHTAPGFPPPLPPPPLPTDDAARSLANVLSPGPAAQRRDAPPPEPTALGELGRRRSDPSAPPSIPPSGPMSSSGPVSGVPEVATRSPSAGAALPRAMPSALSGPRAVVSASELSARAAHPPSSSQPPATNPALIAVPAAAMPPPAAADPPWAAGRARNLSPSPVRGDASTVAVPVVPPPAPPIVPAAPSAPTSIGLGIDHPALPFGSAADRGQAPAVAAARRRSDDGVDPPPTRIHRPEALVDRPFTPPQVSPVPEIPEPGLVSSARYAVRFARARWQRRGAIKLLGSDIKKDTDALDQVLGALGGVARTAKVDGRVFYGENTAITAAEHRAEQITREHNDVDVRKLEENSKFVDIERERNAKLADAERMVDEAQKELAQLEAQRRGLRDKRKELERRQKAYLKAAGDNDRQGGTADMGDARQELRRAAEQHRREAAALEPERQDIDRRLAGMDRPINESTAKLDAAKAELDAAKRSLSDAREGHTHRLAELDAEQKRKAREIAQAEAEIARRLVTLGTLVNLNRIEDPQFEELYQRIDRLRAAITARTTEIEKLTAEREAYDRGNLVRGIATIGGAVLLFIALIVILRAAVR